MHSPSRILIMGASYGSLLASKLLLAGHTVKLVCLPAEAQLINQEGTRVRLPVAGKEGLIEIDSRDLPGELSADVPNAVDPAEFDLVALAMQEPQYGSPGVVELLNAVAQSRVPCMSIMNMPPPPFLKRIPGLAADVYRHCYTDPAIWDDFDPALMTLCSPDPQRFALRKTRSTCCKWACRRTSKRRGSIPMSTLPCFAGCRPISKRRDSRRIRGWSNYP
jgi:hypothetical protein